MNVNFNAIMGDKPKNYGYIKDEPDDRDAVFGSLATPIELLQENADWTEFLPPQELQSKGNLETFSCVPSSILKAVQTLIKRKYGIDRNYSERFLAVLTDTRGGGSSPRDVLQFLRKIGVPLDIHYPFDESVQTEDEYFKPLTEKLMALAKEFTDEWNLRYDEVRLEDIPEALKSSPLCVSVSAWFDRDGIYYKPQEAKDNHLTLLYKVNGVYDTYIDGDEDAFKTLELGYQHETVKRFWIEKKEVIKGNWFQDLIIRIASIFK